MMMVVMDDDDDGDSDGRDVGDHGNFNDDGDCDDAGSPILFA